MTQIIGFVGYGNLNTVLATLAAKAGYRVVINNSRGPETLVKAVAKLGPQAKAASVTDTIKQSDVISLSIPFDQYAHIPADVMAGKIVIDTMNYYSENHGFNENLVNHSIASSELVQRHFHNAYVVKAFNTISHSSMYYGARPSGDPMRWCLPIAGDNMTAKTEVSKFIDAIGFDVADCGSLADSWRFQRGTPAYGSPYFGAFSKPTTVEEMIELQENDHTSVVKTEDILTLLNQAVKGSPLPDQDIPQLWYDAINSNALTERLQGIK